MHRHKTVLFPFREAADTVVAWAGGPISSVLTSTFTANSYSDDNGTAWAIGAGALSGVMGLKASRVDVAKKIYDGADTVELPQDHLVTQIVKDFAANRGMKNVPKACLIHFPENSPYSKVPFAGAAGTEDFGVVLLSPNIADQLTMAELRGVIAHEIEHIHEKDTQLKLASKAASIPVNWTWRCMLAIWLIPYWDAPDSVFYTSLGLKMLNSIADLYSSRACERRADRGAIEITQNPWALSSGLDRIVEIYANNGMLPKSNPKVGQNILLRALRRTFSTHPLTADRQKRLKDMTEELYAKYPERAEALDELRRRTIAEIEKFNAKTGRETPHAAVFSDGVKRRFKKLVGSIPVNEQIQGVIMAAQSLRDGVIKISEKMAAKKAYAPIHEVLYTEEPRYVDSPAYETPAAGIPAFERA